MYKRVILKLSGESFSRSGKTGIDFSDLDYITEEIIKLKNLNIELGIVVGAGNLWRGGRQQKISRVNADYMGMLGTAINSIALKDSLEQKGIKTVIQSRIELGKIFQTYRIEEADKYLRNKYITIFCFGTGNPYFTTDTTAALYAAELNANIFLKATQVDGVYTSDPNINRNAIKYDKLTYKEAIQKRLKIMDITAFTLCMENNIKILVFNFYKSGNLLKAVKKEKIGTVIENG